MKNKLYNEEMLSYKEFDLINSHNLIKLAENIKSSGVVDVNELLLELQDIEGENETTSSREIYNCTFEYKDKNNNLNRFYFVKYYNAEYDADGEISSYNLIKIEF